MCVCVKQFADTFHHLKVDARDAFFRITIVGVCKKKKEYTHTHTPVGGHNPYNLNHTRAKSNPLVYQYPVCVCVNILRFRLQRNNYMSGCIV